jgi:hypothetical protein
MLLAPSKAVLAGEHDKAAEGDGDEPAAEADGQPRQRSTRRTRARDAAAS